MIGFQRIPELLTEISHDYSHDKTKVEPVHSYDAFHTRSDMSGVKGNIGMHRFNMCLVVLSLSCRCLALV